MNHWKTVVCEQAVESVGENSAHAEPLVVISSYEEDYLVRSVTRPVNPTVCVDGQSSSDKIVLGYLDVSSTRYSGLIGWSIGKMVSTGRYCNRARSCPRA